MTKEEYLQKQQELRNRRGEAARTHREIMDEIEAKHHERCSRENEAYRMAKRQEKAAYEQTYQSIEMEMIALKAEWQEQHPECPMAGREEAEQDTNAERIRRQMER